MSNNAMIFFLFSQGNGNATSQERGCTDPHGTTDSGNQAKDQRSGRKATEEEQNTGKYRSILRRLCDVCRRHLFLLEELDSLI